MDNYFYTNKESNVINGGQRFIIISIISDTYLEEFKTELSITEAKIRKLEAENEKLSEDIRKSINDFVWEDEYRTVSKTQQ